MRAVRQAMLIAGILFVGFSASRPARAQRATRVTPDEQEAINKAIKRGVKYLEGEQGPLGTWAQEHRSHEVGYAALPALTLLVCDVPASDATVQSAARLVRARAARLDGTYEISLAVLFLDKLGEKQDEGLIQTLATRLIAGQTITGGWGYKCPLATPKNQTDILTALRKLDPQQPGFITRPRDDNPQKGIIDQTPTRPDQQDKGQGTGDQTPSKDKSNQGTGQDSSTGDNSQGRSGSTKDLSPGAGTIGSSALSRPQVRCIKSFDFRFEEASSPPMPTEKAKVKDVVPAYLRTLPVFVENKPLLVDPKGRKDKPLSATTDNSNTQFATLALWAASRHDVPMKRSMDLIVRRFQTSQNADGGWGYLYRNGGGAGPAGFNNSRFAAPAMTCAGLLGLAVGHGVAGKRAEKEKVDPAVTKGFVALSRFVGKPDEPHTGRRENLYLLWSIERVAVLYDLPMIAGKDWYRWAAQMLVKSQQEEGSWSNSGYWGSSPVIDTCFALLVLKRANLTGDLGSRLPFKPVDLERAVNTEAGVMRTSDPEPPAPAPQPTEKHAPPEILPDGGKTPLPPNEPVPPSTTPATPDLNTPISVPTQKRGVLWVVFIFFILALVAGVACLIVYLNSNGGRAPDRDDYRDPPRRRRPRYED
jgi:hypothetical protein